MQALNDAVRERCRSLLESNEVKCIVGWKEGEFFYDPSPAVFATAEEMDSLVYNEFCGANLSKMAADISRKSNEKIGVLLKPCDGYSMNELLLEHRVDRDKILAIGIPCPGMLAVESLRSSGVRALQSAEIDGGNVKIHGAYEEQELPIENALLERCLACNGKDYVIADETIGEKIPLIQAQMDYDRFAGVAAIEAMLPEERFSWWQTELSRCIRCNACRNTCPACTCIQCVFDDQKSGVASKASPDDFEDNLFHIIRAFHVAGRCTSCGECSRVCPQQIPLHLLNRKLAGDISTLYGNYQAGATSDGKPPLVDFRQDDAEPSVIQEGGVRR